MNSHNGKLRGGKLYDGELKDGELAPQTKHKDQTTANDGVRPTSIRLERCDRFVAVWRACKATKKLNGNWIETG